MHVISSFPKEYKYTLGERIQNASIEMIISIYRANTVRYKSQHLKALQNQVQILYLLLRICHDIKIIPTERYASIVLMVDDIARQTQGWLNATEKSRESVQVTA